MGDGAVIVAVLRLAGHEDLEYPTYATAAAAGADLRAAVQAPLRLEPGDRALVPTGLCLGLPAGYEGQVRARSGRAAREGLALLNAPGTIDADYRGEVQVLVVNHGREPIEIRRGERIAQLVVAPVARVRFEPAERLPGSARGDGGFGHTGV